MYPIISSAVEKLSRIARQIKARIQRAYSYFHPSSFQNKISSLKEDTAKEASIERNVENNKSESYLENKQSVAVSSVQWQLDNPYSEKPLYQTTVVYVDLNSEEELARSKNTRSAGNTTSSGTKPLPRITHYPPTHRLH